MKNKQFDLCVLYLHWIDADAQVRGTVYAQIKNTRGAEWIIPISPAKDYTSLAPLHFVSTNKLPTPLSIALFVQSQGLHQRAKCINQQSEEVAVSNCQLRHENYLLPGVKSFIGR